MSFFVICLIPLFTLLALAWCNELDEFEPNQPRRQLLGQKTKGTDAKTLIASASHYPLGTPMKFEKWSTPHIPSSQAIFSCAFSTTYMAKDAIFFAGTARKTGFKGDIVVAVLPGSQEDFLNKLKEYNVSVYTAQMECTGHSDVRCKFHNVPDYPVTLLRHFFYQQWAIKYPESAYIMLADFRDVLFQSNPFKNKFWSWGPENYDLTLFQEAHPNRVLNRCPHMGGFLLRCYGKDVYRKLGANVVSSSGVVFGLRDAIMVYTQLINNHANVEGRMGVAANATFNNKNCWGLGVDQAFHNYLLYSGRFHELMTVKLFPQGEGPVNTVGGFFGEKKILRASLAEWKLLRGEAPYQYVYNWNGEISSVVHQLDRFLYSELAGGYAKYLAVLQHI
mmetsp:Transcript_10930/g.17806  ORF Transcript_10930/g.17806 Transcript_10930/m.17806 type:complete len:391 (+) Transcript_10930:73-1245(+)